MIISTKDFFDFFKKEIEDGEDFFLNLPFMVSNIISGVRIK